MTHMGQGAKGNMSYVQVSTLLELWKILFF